MTSKEQGPRRLEDARTMRALAHPVRMLLMEQLTLRGPLTATQCAALVGESPSSCSFHLRTLAKYGFIEEAEGGTGRQRPWRAVTLGHQWESSADTPAATRTAAAALSAMVRERDRQVLEEYLARADEFEPAWEAAVIHDNYGGYLTPDELATIGARLYEMWRPYIDRLSHPEDRPAGARLVHMFAHGFPRADGLDEIPANAPSDERPDQTPSEDDHA
ncbi:MAG: helix-turn-helix domain-containing protein [Actinomycetes bacterium]